VRVRAFLAAVAVVPSPASAAEPVHLAPSSPWAVDYAANSCRLVRHFAQGGDATILALESQAPGALDMMIVSKRAVTMDEQAWARFVPTQTKLIEGIAGRATDKSLVPVLLFPDVDLLADDEIAAQKKDKKSGRRIRVSGRRQSALVSKRHGERRGSRSQRRRPRSRFIPAGIIP